MGHEWETHAVGHSWGKMEGWGYSICKKCGAFSRDNEPQADWLVNSRSYESKSKIANYALTCEEMMIKRVLDE